MRWWVDVNHREIQCEEVDVNHVRNTEESEGKQLVRILIDRKCTPGASPAA